MNTSRVIVSIVLVSLLIPNQNFGQNSKTIPQNPTQLEVLDIAFDFVYINWKDNSDNEDIFIIERHVEGEEFSTYDSVNANETSFLDYRVESNTIYYYRILAKNLDGLSGYSNEIFTTTLILPNNTPNAPSALEGSFNDIDATILSWQDNSTNELKFHINRSTNGVDFFLHDSVDRDISAFKDYSIVSRQSYYYFIQASNNYGVSDPSDTIQVDVSEIVTETAPVLSLLGVSSTEIQLAWDSLAGAQIKYLLTRTSGTEIINREFENIYNYIDSDLEELTLYSYQLAVINQNIDTSYSNILEIYTLPWYTQDRVKDSLVAFFPFTHVIKDSIQDYSWYSHPVNLHITDTSAIEDIYPDYLKLSEENLLHSTSSEKIINACKGSNELSIECWLKTSEMISNAPAKIISLENDSSVAFSMSCIKTQTDQIMYYANLTTKSTDQQGNPDITILEPVETGLLHHVVFTHNKAGEEILYINGQIAVEGFRPPKFKTWSSNYSTVIANSIYQDSPWLGDLYLCAIYNRALSNEEILQNYNASPFSEIDYIINSEDYYIYAYPSPVNDKLLLEFRNEITQTDITQKYIFRMVDAQGIIVYQKMVSEYMINDILELDVSNFTAGIYTMILSNSIKIIDEKKVNIIHN